MANNIYTSKSPKLDLHGETRDFLPYLINKFITENIAEDNKFIVIIHGWNSDILKKEVQRILKKETRVKNYFIDPSNIGQTIIELDI